MELERNRTKRENQSQYGTRIKHFIFRSFATMIIKFHMLNKCTKIPFHRQAHFLSLVSISLIKHLQKVLLFLSMTFKDKSNIPLLFN